MAETLRSLQLRVAKLARELEASNQHNISLERKLESLAKTPGPRSALDVQIGGDHYKSLEIQPIEYILANNLPFIEGNIVKYATRWRDKGGIKDLQKIQHFAQLLIEDTQAKQEVEAATDGNFTKADAASAIRK